MDTDNRKYMWRDHARDFIKALVDDYKYGKISAEETFAKAEEFLSTYRVNFHRDDDLRRAVEEVLPETCRVYRETPDEKQRLLAFWKGLKDCDQLLFCGRTFTEDIQDYINEGMDRCDPSEYTDEYLAIEPELEKLIREETGEGNYLGYCHLYWSVKKRILWEKYGIEWHSPSERYPGIMFD